MLVRRNQNWLPSVFNDFFDTDFLPKMNVTSPAINVIEKESEYDVEFAAPGMTKEDFTVSIDADENLVINLEKKQNTEDKNADGHYLRREFSYTKFHQTLLLPDDVNREAITATVQNGVLTVTLPKMKAEEVQKQPKVIEIS